MKYFFNHYARTDSKVVKIENKLKSSDKFKPLLHQQVVLDWFKLINHLKIA